jgi:hypothetical protein
VRHRGENVVAVGRGRRYRVRVADLVPSRAADQRGAGEINRGGC